MPRTLSLAIAILICQLSLVPQALSQEPPAMTGNDLSLDCEAHLRGAADFNSGFCMGFITGSWYAFGSIEGQKLFCDPPNATVGQAVKIVQKYLADHPERLHEEALLLVLDALKGAVPCR